MVICTQKINEGYKYFPDVKGLMQFLFSVQVFGLQEASNEGREMVRGGGGPTPRLYISHNRHTRTQCKED
jgi:hypothetical protein